MDALERGVRQGNTSLVSENIDLYYRGVDVSLRLDNRERAFFYAEKLRAQALLERLTLERALSAEGVKPGVRREMLELAQEIENLTRRRSSLVKAHDERSRKLLRELGDDLERARERFRVLDEGLLRENEHYRALRDPEILSLEGARKLAPEKGAIIEYVLYQDEEHGNYACAIVITREKARVVELDRDAPYSDWIGALSQELQAGSRGGDVYGKRLHGLLIKPLEEYLPGGRDTRLIIVPDGPLGLLPFNALVGEGGRPMAETHVISLSPSVSILALQQVRKRRFSGLVALGDVPYRGEESPGRGGDLTPGVIRYYANRGGEEYYTNVISSTVAWPYLRETSRELKTIAGIAGGRSLLLKGEDASETRLRYLSDRGELKKRSILHFAAHGYFDQDYPGYSSVVLAEAARERGEAKEDGYLSVEEAATLRLGTDLVMLSACETGRGETVQGRGVVGLAYAFQLAGSRNVGVTLWQVDDRKARIFMAAFYRRAREYGWDNYVRALVETRREFIKKGWSPYHWAGYEIYGR
jgi:CHAT domain-containing protein